jgi:ubiquitin-protein ligase
MTDTLIELLQNTRLAVPPQRRRGVVNPWGVNGMSNIHYAIRRIQTELRNKDTFSYFHLDHDPDSILRWKAYIYRLPSERHAGKKYILEIICPERYPLVAPEVRFLSDVENSSYVDRATGEFCNNMLRDGWLPSMTLKSTVLYICSFLCDE